MGGFIDGDTRNGRFLGKGKSHRSKWMMAADSSIFSGNPHNFIQIDLKHNCRGEKGPHGFAVKKSLDNPWECPKFLIGILVVGSSEADWRIQKPWLSCGFSLDPGP